MLTGLPDLARAIAAAVRDAGGRALVVGGWVRDALLGRTSKDLDLEVFGVPADRLLALVSGFGRVDTVGESFTVYKVAGIDVSLPRRESKTGRGHKGSRCRATRSCRSKRPRGGATSPSTRSRCDPLTGEILDPVQRPARPRGPTAARGRPGDVRRRQPARAARAAVRGAIRARRSTEDTRALCRAIPLDDLPAERVWGEIEKLLLQAARPSIGLALALDLGVVDRLWPELHALVGCPQEPEWHPEGDVWVHTLMVVDQARKRIDGLARGPAAAMMLGAICHDLGKPATTAVIDGRIRSPGHEEAGVEPATALPRSAQRAFARWLRRAPGRARPRRAASEAERVSQVADAGQRRRVPPARAEGRSRAARALREGRLPRPHGHVRLLGDGLVSRARAGARRRARGRPRRSSSAGTCSRSASSPARAWASCSPRSTTRSSRERSRRSTRGSRWRASVSRRIARKTKSK